MGRDEVVVIQTCYGCPCTWASWRRRVGRKERDVRLRLRKRKRDSDGVPREREELITGFAEDKTEPEAEGLSGGEAER